MEGKRVAQVERDAGLGPAGKAALVILILLIVLAVGAAAGVGVYANHVYEGVFPGVSVSGIALEGQSLEKAQATLDEKLSARLAAETVTVSADGKDLGIYDLATLGAHAETQTAAQAAYAVGREAGAMGWVMNGLTMAKAFLGETRDLDPAVTYDAAVIVALVDEMAQRFDEEPVDAAYELTEEGLFATKERNGRVLEREALAAMLLTASGSVEAPWSEVPARALDLQSISDEISAEALPTRYDIELGCVVAGQVGVAMDVDAAQYVMDAAAEGERVQLPAEVVYPVLTVEELEAVLFRDLLSTASTSVSGTAARRGNVKLSGESVNGTVLNPGDVFDYNTVVGMRTAERGYGFANAYVNGETVDVIGGGICQTSSTLYYATLLANLEIVERHAHRYVSGYIEKGMDATVSWGGPEFKFRNNTDYPIYIEVTYAKNVITVKLYGTKTDDTYVKMTHEVISTTPSSVIYQETADLPYGTQSQKQTAYTGYLVKSYRNIYDGDGKLISSTLEATSNYKSRDEIILVGTAGKPAGGTGGSTETGGFDEPVLPEEEEPTMPELPGIITPEEEMPDWLLPTN